MKRKQINPRILIRIPQTIQQQMLDDLRRPHAHAYERVGFLMTKSKWLEDSTIVILAINYQAVADENYIEDLSVGAKINSTAIREAMQTIRAEKAGCFHVHLHDHKGLPTPSGVDRKGLPGVVESLSNASADQPTGYLILSQNSLFSAVQLPNFIGFKIADTVTIVGYPMSFVGNTVKRKVKSQVFDRQAFLGPNAQAMLNKIRIGVVGYGGGGSHVGQQLAHIGVGRLSVFDGDRIERSNLNRLVGGRWYDTLTGLPKTTIAKRVVKSILPSAKVTIVEGRWQSAPEKLQECDVVIGCVDTYAERQQLEAECRRYLIPYVDIGMDVYQSEDEAPAMSGQVMLSIPGGPCFWCYGFLTEGKLGKEAAKYGNVGGRPQVVWPNGVLASTAVGVVIDLLTGWTRRRNPRIYFEYEGNTGMIK